MRSEEFTLKLSDLCSRAGVAFPLEKGELEIDLVIDDSRLAKPNSLYVCIKGFHCDGHDCVDEAIRKGAICVLMQSGYERELPENVCALVCENTRRASAELFNAFYGDPVSKLKFIGVTGTNGKTSVTHMLRAILEASLCKCGLIGTVGCESAGRFLETQNRNPNANMTTPDPSDLYRMLAEMVGDGVEYVLMEVTSHALALEKLSPIDFEAGIFTNLTPEHLDFHGSMEAYAAAKAKLFERCKISVLSADSLYLPIIKKGVKGKLVTCSAFSREESYRAEKIRMSGQLGVDYELVSDRARVQIRCPIPGHFTVMNTMQAAACALELGFGAAAVKEALGSLLGIRGRMERVRLGHAADFTVFIDYAHTPDALEKLLRTAKDFGGEGQRVVVVFGCGGDRDKSKRPLMGAVAERYADCAIVTSDNSRSEDPEQIIEEILSGMKERPTVIVDRAEAIRYAVLRAKPKDVILLAGKGHEQYELRRDGKIPFSEKEIVLKAFEERVRQTGRTDQTDGS